MISVLLILIISFLLEGVISNFISLSSNFFLPLFSIISLVVIYPFFNNDNSKFLRFSFALGIFYDLIYTDTFLLNGCIFLATGYLIKQINKRITNNAFNVIIISIIVVVFYRFITYMTLLFIGYLTFEWQILIKSIYSSLILNILYGLFLYLIADYFSRKYRIQKID